MDQNRKSLIYWIFLAIENIEFLQTGKCPKIFGKSLAVSAKTLDPGAGSKLWKNSSIVWIAIFLLEIGERWIVE